MNRPVAAIIEQAGATQRRAADPDRRRALGERYRARVEREFTWARSAARAEDLLRASPRDQSEVASSAR